MQSELSTITIPKWDLDKSQSIMLRIEAELDRRGVSWEVGPGTTGDGDEGAGTGGACRVEDDECINEQKRRIVF